MEIIDISTEQHTGHAKRKGEIEHHTSNGVESQGNSLLVSCMRKELNKLSPLSPECCIYRAQQRLRQQNVQAFTPQIVSIGPLHYNKKEEYKAMEEHKWRYLQMFLNWIGMSLENAVEFIKVQETTIRNCYAPTIDLESDEFVKVILLDATFILNILCRNLQTVQNDRIYGRSRLLEDTVLDMFLLENQLPFIILVDLFQLAKKAFPLVSNEWPSIFELCRNSFKPYCQSNGIPKDIERSDIKHMIDLLRHCHLPSKELLPRKFDFKLVPTVTELHEAGVKFKVASSKNLLDVQFTNGVLTIPRMNLDFRAEVLFRNLLAFEQCHYYKDRLNKDRLISEYFLFMDGLINSPKDVELLIQFGIIVNKLGDNEAASTLFTNLSKGLTCSGENFYLCNLFEDLIEYGKVPHHKWIATLKHKHFNNPWKISSIVAAVILLILTFIQAVCSIISVA